jgi:predicted GTPase
MFHKLTLLSKSTTHHFFSSVTKLAIKSSKKRKRSKKTLFNTIYPFQNDQIKSINVPNAGAIFCTEKPEYLGPIPPDEHHDTREVAFVGRSNVGKSTLVGALFQQPQMVQIEKLKMKCCNCVTIIVVIIVIVNFIR